MICSLYLTKVLESNHKLESTLTRTGIVTTITFLDSDLKGAVISIDPRKNNIQVGINDNDWEEISNTIYKWNQEV